MKNIKNSHYDMFVIFSSKLNRIAGTICNQRQTFKNVAFTFRG